MKHISNSKSKNSSIWMSGLIGIVVALLVSMIGSILCAFLIDAGSIGENAYSGISAVTWFLSSLIGTLIACKKASQQYLIVSGITALGYLLVLVAVQILFFDSQFDQIWRGILITAAGMIPSILLCSRFNGRKKAKVKYRSV